MIGSGDCLEITEVPGEPTIALNNVRSEKSPMAKSTKSESPRYKYSPESAPQVSAFICCLVSVDSVFVSIATELLGMQILSEYSKNCQGLNREDDRQLHLCNYDRSPIYHRKF